MKKLEFKACLPLTIDLPELWFSIEDHDNVHLGGENEQYIVTYCGEPTHGLEVLKVILKNMEEYSIFLRTVQEVDNVKEEKETGETPSDSQ